MEHREAFLEVRWKHSVDIRLEKNTTGLIKANQLGLAAAIETPKSAEDIMKEG